MVSPIDDSPAAEAGIEAGDLIVKMNGNPVRGMSLQKAIEKMRGEKGTSIKLTVYREGEDDTIDIDVVRDIIQVSAVRNRLLEPGFGYVRVAQFQRKSGSDFVEALQELKQQTCSWCSFRVNCSGQLPLRAPRVDHRTATRPS